MSRSSAIPVNRDVPTFDVVDAVTPVGAAPCADCRGPIVDTYYEADQSVICATCHARATARGISTTGDRFTRGLAFGALAALASATAYVALLAVTGRELSIVLLFVGLVVGKAVRIGAVSRGGRRFQWLAAVLTYIAIATTYVPFVVTGYSRESSRSLAAAAETAPVLSLDARFLTVAAQSAEAEPAPSLGGAAIGFGGLLLLALAAPFLESANHIVTTLITMAALAHAWRLNRLVDRTISGPYRVRPSAS